MDILRSVAIIMLSTFHKMSGMRDRGSYMSAHVLLNLLNELGKRDKKRGLPSILSLFRNEFNKFNKTRARMLDYIYHMTLKGTATLMITMFYMKDLDKP